MKILAIARITAGYLLKLSGVAVLICGWFQPHRMPCFLGILTMPLAVLLAMPLFLLGNWLTSGDALAGVGE